MTKVMAKTNEAEKCLICGKLLKGCWYSYMVGVKPIELCEDCENLLRIKMLEQAAGELFGQQIGRHIIGSAHNITYTKEDIKNWIIAIVKNCKNTLGFYNTEPRRDIPCGENGNYCMACRRLIKIFEIVGDDLK
jgi:hypothetical protein